MVLFLLFLSIARLILQRYLKGLVKNSSVTGHTSILLLQVNSGAPSKTWVSPALHLPSRGLHVKWSQRELTYVAWWSRRSREPRRARESISSTWSWQRCPWKSLVTFFSSFTREAGSTNLPRYGDA